MEKTIQKLFVIEETHCYYSSLKKAKEKVKPSESIARVWVSLGSKEVGKKTIYKFGEQFCTIAQADEEIASFWSNA